MSITLGPIYNNQNGKVREWSITIELFDQKDKQIPISENAQEVKEGWYSSFWTRSGYTGMKMTDSARTVVSVGKNIGKKNETNVLTQALNQCRSKYTAKINSGYTETRESTLQQSDVAPMPFPMAVKSWKDHKSKLEYPLFIQPKLDGIRMVASYKNGEVQMFTRRLHKISGFEGIAQELKKLFQSSGATDLIIDGELYAHGMNLQHISGIVRNEAIDETEKQKLKYYVFDCFDTTKPTEGFETRVQRLEHFTKSAKSKMIVLNDTLYVETDKKAEQYYKRFVADGYEGVIYKSKDRPYEFDYNKEKRSSWYLKRKKQDDNEYPIVGFTQGKGKDLGCVVFELRTEQGRVFNCVPNGTYDYRKQLYATAVQSFDSSFKDKLAKVVYDDLSKDGVPLRGRIVQIDRDLSFD